MRIADYRLYPYRLPLVRRLAVRGNAAGCREGALLLVQSAGGAMGWGDVAPLGGVSPESLAEAMAAVHAGMGALQGRELLAPDVFDRPAQVLGSAAFASDGAVLSCLAAESGLALRLVFADDAPETIAVNALLDGEPDAVLVAARVAVAGGYRSLKLKVGRRALAEEADLVRRVREAVGDEIGLRLDANRAWSLAEAQAFADRLGDTRIEYIEEPLRDPAGMAQLSLPVALDESLAEAGWEDRGAVAAVIKPSLQDGIAGALRMARRARTHGMQPLISSLFESGVGIRLLAALAAGIGDPDTAHGLDTLQWFAEDVAEPAPAVRGGRLAVDADPYSLLILNPSVVGDIGHGPTEVSFT